MNGSRFCRLFGVIVLSLAVVSNLAAIDEPEKTEAPQKMYPNALGAAFGPISGVGLHYHRWDGQTGWQVTGGIVYFPPGQGPGETSLDYNLGAALQWQVYQDVFSPWLSGSLALFAGGNHRGYIPVTVSGSTFSNGSYQAEFTLGPGVGIELVLFEHFSIPVEFGYGASWTATESNLSEAFRVQLYAQTALRYRY
jgi:hypothetical protein